MALAAATLALALPAAASAFGPVSSFGSDGEAAGQLSAPSGIAVAADGRTFVADSGNGRVSVFNPAGEFLYAFGKGVAPSGADVCNVASGCRRGAFGAAAGTLANPEGIAISNAGDVYVTEPTNNRVSVFSAQGVFLFAFGNEVRPDGLDQPCTAASGCQAGTNPPLGGEEGSNTGLAGALGEPSGIAIDASGRVFVVEAANNRVSVFDPLGTFSYALGLEVEPGKSYPEGSTCTTNCREGNSFGISGPTGIGIFPDGTLVLSDTGNRRLDFYTAEGSFIRSAGKGVGPVSESEPTAPHDVCTDLNVCAEGEEGAVDAGALAEPAGLATIGNSIYVGDVGLERVSQFTAVGGFVRAFGAGVVDGAPAFEVCSAATGCRAGLQTTVPGATPKPFGVAEACRSGVFVAESAGGLSRVERFGEAAEAFTPPCPTPATRAQQPAPIVTRLVPSNFFAIGRLQRHPRKGTATLAVTVPAGGQLILGGRGLHPVTRTAGAAGRVELPLKLVGKPRRRLFRSGHRTVGLHVTFAPTGGTARSEGRPVTLVKKPKARAKHRHHRRHREKQSVKQRL